MGTVICNFTHRTNGVLLKSLSDHNCEKVERAFQEFLMPFLYVNKGMIFCVFERWIPNNYLICWLLKIKISLSKTGFVLIVDFNRIMKVKEKQSTKCTKAGESILAL